MSGSEGMDRPVPGADWEGEGYRVGATLGDRHAVVVLGADREATALVALGIARSQAMQHRVALGDLLGDAPPIQRLVTDEDPHGLVDSFLYGVSLNRIAHRVPESGELYVLPSGTEPPDYVEILASPRWRRLATGFREENALLVLAAPADAPHVEDLVASTDGAILVGDEGATTLPADRVIATISPAEAAPAIEERVEATDESPPAPLLEPTTVRPRRGRRIAAAAGVVLAAGLAGAGIWLAARPLAGGHEPLWLRRHRDTASAAGSLPSTLRPASASDSGTSSTAGGAGSALAPANPGDSATASAYGVTLMTMNTLLGAETEFQKMGASLPATTYAPVLMQGYTWYRVMIGAAHTEAEADSLLRVLRARGQLRSDVGQQIVRVPYAFLVDSGIPPAAVPGLLSYWAKRGQPIYALLQEDGTARLYAGAFESPRQAALFVEPLKASGIAPVLVYRTGRVN